MAKKNSVAALPPTPTDSWFEAEAIIAIWKSESRRPTTMLVLSIDANAGEKTYPEDSTLIPESPPHTRYCKCGIGFVKNKLKPPPCKNTSQKKITPPIGPLGPFFFDRTLNETPDDVAFGDTFVTCEGEK